MSRESLAQGRHVPFDMEALVGYLLAAGVILSMFFIAAGLAWHLVTTGDLALSYQVSGMNFFEFVLRDVQQIIVTGFGPRRLVSLGIATLMLTPFVRVLASMLYFAFAAHNWKYSAFTLFVLSVLTYSLFLR
jgi:uncharacterized membrane protein